MERQREIQRREWAAEEQERKIEHERQRQENARRDSRNDLNLIIEEWAKQKSIVNFFNEIEAVVSDLNPPRRGRCLNA